MRIKKGDIITDIDFSEIVISCKSYSVLNDCSIDNEIIFCQDNISFRKCMKSWKKKATGKYDEVIGMSKREASVIGNYFKLKNKRKLIKGLMSADIETRKFFVEIIKNESKKR